MGSTKRPVREDQYGVKFSVPWRPLEHADIKFEVKDREGKLGDLLISRGAIEWKPYKKKRTPRPRKLTWQQFDGLWFSRFDR